MYGRSNYHPARSHVVSSKHSACYLGCPKTEMFLALPAPFHNFLRHSTGNKPFWTTATNVRQLLHDWRRAMRPLSNNCGRTCPMSIRHRQQRRQSSHSSRQTSNHFDKLATFNCGHSFLDACRRTATSHERSRRHHHRTDDGLRRQLLCEFANSRTQKIRGLTFTHRAQLRPFRRKPRADEYDGITEHHEGGMGISQPLRAHSSTSRRPTLADGRFCQLHRQLSPPSSYTFFARSSGK